MNRFLIPAALAMALLAACGGEKAPAGGGAAPGASDALKGFTLAADPGDAVSVKEAREKEGDAVVVGRVQEIVKGYASFRLVDAALQYCGQDPASDDDCETPWDFCCIPKDELAANMILVEAQGTDGRPVASAAIPDLRLLDLVAVKGKLQHDEHGNVTLLAKGWYRRERP